MHWGKELHEMMRMYSSMKALQLLVALAESEEEVPLAKLSAMTGIPPSSTHRILQEMQHCGFVVAPGPEGTIRLNGGAVVVEAAADKYHIVQDLLRSTGSGRGSAVAHPSGQAMPPGPQAALSVDVGKDTRVGGNALALEGDLPGTFCCQRSGHGPCQEGRRAEGGEQLFG